MGDFVDSNNDKIGRSSMVDEHQIITINEKTPTPQNIGKIVRGDTNSNILTFEMNRYYDGVDLSDKNIKILVNNNVDNVFIEDVVNLQTTDELIRFSWIMGYATTKHKGTIKAAVQIYGEEENKQYVLKTTPFNVIIEDTLDTSDMPLLYPNWFVFTELKLSELEQNLPNNKEVLEKLSESEEGTLLFDGKAIQGTGGGEKGDPGKDGKTYTPKIGTVTSGVTADASVNVSEEDLTATFNFVLPTGADVGNSSMSYEETMEYLNGDSANDAVDSESDPVTPPHQPSDLKIVTFSDGTDEELKAMLDAHYAGDINIHDYWHVGDERTVHLSAMDVGNSGIKETHAEQDVTMVLVNEGGKILEDGSTECAYVVDQKNVLNNKTAAEEGIMNLNHETWDSCQRRTWCNSIYYNSISANFRAILKKHKNYTGAQFNNINAGVIETIDWCALPSEVEIFGKNTYSVAGEGVQFDYYKYKLKVFKFKNNLHGVASSTAIWFLRSPRNDHNSVYVCVGTDGESHGYSNSAASFAPIFCI